MNRFEHVKPNIREKLVFLLPILAFVLLLFFFMGGIQSIEETTRQKQQESLETAVSRSIAHCYAAEGHYPESIDYLVEHYGLTYDSELFFVDYDFFGNNLLPDVVVLRKGSNSED